MARSETEQDQQRMQEEQRRLDEERRADRAGSREDDRERRRRMERAQGAWPYAGPMSAAGYRAPGYMGYPGYMSYPWSRLSHGMDPSYGDWQGPAFGTQGPGGWKPRVETFQRGDDMIVRVELPGWDKDEVSAFVEDEDLVVEGRREEDVDEEERHGSEPRGDDRRRDEMRESRRYAAEHFSTRISLPATVETGDVKAKFKNGVLEVKIPMPERQSERRTVKIDT